MKITIENDKITVTSPSSEVKQIIQSLTYVDKSKQFQASRMSNSPFWKNSHALQEVKDQINNQVYERRGDTYVIPGGFAYLFEEQKLAFEDARNEKTATMHFPWAKKPFELRPYQKEAVDLVVAHKRGVVSLATGLGKSLCIVYAVKELKRKSLIIVPTINLANQMFEDFAAAFGRHRVGVYGGGKKKLGDVTIGVANSVYRNIDLIAKEEIGLTIIDEAHHSPANSIFEIAQKLGATGRVFGFTATPYRADGKDILISAACGKILIDRDIKWGIENNFLATPHFFIRKVNTKAQEFRADKLKNYKAHVLHNLEMRDAIFKDCFNFVQNKIPTLILVDMVEHGRALEASLGAMFATGEDKNSYSYIEAFNKGKIDCLIATEGAAGEGVDIKRIKALVLANFAASKGLVMQCIGRALRKAAGKESCVIFDYSPEGSEMLKRHAKDRLALYKQITSNIKLI